MEFLANGVIVYGEGEKPRRSEDLTWIPGTGLGLSLRPKATDLARVVPIRSQETNEGGSRRFVVEDRKSN